MDEVTITRHPTPAGGEYHAHVPGSSAIGRLTWTRQGAVRIADHTIVPPEIGGRGIAALLVDALVADAREQGFRIDPECSYIAAAFKRHPDWADLLSG
ncbi:GNAT family N-acetyltransferase [Novosphingobium sp.]|uniref:GNAT family N-acetyltransferase n=1 Tax=Novosphingobium sp. TaxID=1874826 RepID=UPI0027345827|nr:GNAT family N-acetyltransferase [Novosphingobium sp.]MDP3906174.1 GNAT family N-acetyltransferase [Novosphingobium sp.]